MQQPKSSSQAPGSPDWITESALWGEPKRGGGEFLVAVRQKLEGPRAPQLWLTRSRVLAVSALAVMFVIGVWLPGTGGDSMADNPDLNEAFDELTLTDISAQDLADYLELSLPDVQSDEVVEVDVSVVATDELLLLNDAEFDGLLRDLQATNFF